MCNTKCLICESKATLSVMQLSTLRVVNFCNFCWQREQILLITEGDTKDYESIKKEYLVKSISNE